MFACGILNELFSFNAFMDSSAVNLEFFNQMYIKSYFYRTQIYLSLAHIFKLCSVVME